jgi:hypothetical protein
MRCDQVSSAARRGHADVMSARREAARNMLPWPMHPCNCCSWARSSTWSHAPVLPRRLVSVACHDRAAPWQQQAGIQKGPCAEAEQRASTCLGGLAAAMMHDWLMSPAEGRQCHLSLLLVQPAGGWPCTMHGLLAGGWPTIRWPCTMHACTCSTRKIHGHSGRPASVVILHACCPAALPDVCHRHSAADS